MPDRLAPSGSDPSPAARLAKRATPPDRPRSAGYDPQWMIENAMGPNPIWLLEWLCSAIEIPVGARVLDLGCGKALTSIFLAREYGAQVTAADLWISPDDNWQRIKAAGCDDRVTPIRAEAHDLPFAEGYFDVIVSVDAYTYFGTDDTYLGYLSRFLRPGGTIGVVSPGLVRDFDEVPEHMVPYWDPEFWTFHTAAWWRRHWTRADTVTVTVSDLLADGWVEWADWNEACVAAGDSDYVRCGAEREAQLLRLDAGSTLGLVRIAGTRI